MKNIYVTDRFHIKMLPYVPATLKVRKASIIDVKRAILKGARTYIYKEENALRLSEFMNTNIGVTTEPLILSRDEEAIIYVITTLKTLEGEKKFIWRLEYKSDE